jgi:hypothetical protein
MLISHSRRFIYLKTVKTAGTSVEAYFEKHCLPPDQQVFQHSRECYEGPTGVVGFRGENARRHPWFNHMSAAAIRAKIAPAQWTQYFKFCVVRDPFDKLVSGFHMFDKRRHDRPWPKRLRAAWLRLRGKGDPIDRVTGTTPVQRFRSWIGLGGMIDDRDVYTLDGKLCADHFIRFERLADGVREVCERLGLEFRADDIPRLKSDSRQAKIPLADYYDDACVSAVRRVYARELEFFGYAAPVPSPTRSGAAA